MSSATKFTSPEIASYIQRMKREADEIIEQTYTLAGRFDIGDATLRRSFHLEATALACHWIEAFSEATPEMLNWAKLFTKRLEIRSDAKAAYDELGASGGSSQFFNNRREFYKHNHVTFQPDYALLTSWAGILRFCVMFQDLKAPPIIAADQDAEILMQPRTKDDPRVESTLGLDPNSDEYIEILAKWLKGFTDFLLRITSNSNEAHIDSIIAAKEADKKSEQIFNRFKFSFIALGGWLILLPMFDFSEIWIFQLTKIGVTTASIFLAIILSGWQRVVAIIIAVLFNPLVPIQFDEDAWRVVDFITGVFFGIIAFWPQPHTNAEQEMAPNP